MMNDKPRFEIIEQIGHGQFSNVYKARWVNAPLINFAASCPPPPIADFNQTTTPTTTTTTTTTLNPFLDGYNHQQLSSPLDCIYDGHSTMSNQQSINYSNNNNNNNLSLQSSSTMPSYGEKYVALKKIKFYDIQNSKLRMDCLKEVKLLQQLKHPNIINYNISFIERNELFIVLELADGGDLSKLIKYFQKRKQLISERTILKYFTQVCSAVKYIHSKRILHRDIKPANIFMTSNGVVKLGDFGLGRFFSQNTLNAHSIVGTFYYMSPERIREAGYSFSSDVWSLGCVLYELITLNSPFSVLNIETPQQQQPNYNQKSKKQQQQQQQQQTSFNLQWLIDRICRAEYPSLANFNDISLRLRHLSTECLNPNPDARPNMDYMCAVVYEAYQVQQQKQQLQQRHHHHQQVSSLNKNHVNHRVIKNSHHESTIKRHQSSLIDSNNPTPSLNQMYLINNDNNNTNTNRQTL